MRFGKHPIVVVAIVSCVLAAGIAIARDDQPTPTPVTVIADYFIAPCRLECQVTKATDVFVGRVASRAPGTPVVEPLPSDTRITRPVPATLYAVDVLRTLRGAAAGRVVVQQTSNFDEPSFDARSDGPPLLEPGEVAIFAAVWDGDAAWYELLSGRLGHYRLSANADPATAVAEFESLFGTPIPGTPVGRGSPKAQR